MIPDIVKREASALGLKPMELADGAVHEVGKKYWCGYWRYCYEVLAVSFYRNGCLKKVDIRLEDGTVRSHSTPLTPGSDYVFVQESSIQSPGANPINTLLNALDKLYSSSGVPSSCEDSAEYFDSCALVDEAEGLCCQNLITSSGRCNWNNIKLLRRCGYSVFAGESDSFGWLTGCVQKDGDPRILVYG